MLKITGTMMLVLMWTTLTASAAWSTLTVDEYDQSSTQETYLTAETTINGNGMYDGAGYEDLYHNNNMTYDFPAKSPIGMMWLSEIGDAAETAWIAFGFDSLVTIENLKVWNFNDVSKLDAGINEFRIRYTTDTGLPLASRTWTTLEGTSTLARANGDIYYEGNDPIALPGLDVTGIMLEVISTHGLSQAGLSEIHFEGEVVPEPATMGLLAVGGLAMLRSRRRRNNK